MKWFTLCAVLSVLVAGNLLAQAQGVSEPRTPAAEARKKIGELAVVTGVVAEVHKTDKVAHINVGGRFPTNQFTTVVFARNFKLFPDLEKLAGKRIEVSGKVEEYQGKPQIVVSSKGHLHVVEDKPAN